MVSALLGVLENILCGYKILEPVSIFFEKKLVMPECLAYTGLASLVLCKYLALVFPLCHFKGLVILSFTGIFEHSLYLQ